VHCDEIVVICQSYKTSDLFEAAFLKYLGFVFVRSDSIRGAKTSWEFRVPAHDLIIAKEEFTNAETTLLLVPYISAIKSCQSAEKRARDNMGIYTTPAYTSN
jgi:hypothetical protein